MPYTPRDGDFTLFPNDRKTSPKHPDWKGSGLFQGQECWISGWNKTGKRGDFISCRVEPKDRDGDRF